MGAESIAALQIRPELSREVDLSSGDDTATVVGGSLGALHRTLTEQHKKDVMECLLLAQLAADAKADRHADVANWYKAYQRTLETIGWVTSVTNPLVHYAPGMRFTIADVVFDLFRRKVNDIDLQSLIATTLNTFRNSESGTLGQYIFECPSHSGGVGNFQVALATEEDAGIVQLEIGRFAFNVPTYVGKLANFQFPADARFQVGFLALTLNEEVYDPIRTSVTDKLGNRLSASVVQLQI